MKAKILHPMTGGRKVRSLSSGVSSIFTPVLLLFLLCANFFASAQAPSHDPTAMVRAEDGRYWIFTTGEGVWAMSSSNTNFSDWRAERGPFQPGTWPSWINSAVPGFAGDFWAPGITRMGGYWYLYYSCSSFGSSRSAIGVARTSSLSNPNWQDLGMVVSSNGSSSAINAIDPAIFHDANGRVWMSYGSFFGGLGVVEINPGTGKAIGGVTKVAGGNHQDIEAPYIIRNGNYYYLFVNRGRCCRGLESTYYVQVARSTSITGPYTGWRTILGNEGRYVGPGHIGYGEGRLTYHYYDGYDNGAAKLRITSLGWSNGWPVIHGSGGWVSPTPVYQLRNRGTGLYLDGMGLTTNGDACGQYANTSHPNSQWRLVDVGNGYSQLQNVGTGLFLDGMGRTENGADCGMWANTTHQNSHWSVQQYSGSYYRIRNRGTGLYLDGMGRTSNGSNAGQWANTTHANSQWQLVSVAGARVADVDDEVAEASAQINLYPNPTDGYFTLEIPDFKGDETIRILNIMGKEMIKMEALEQTQEINISDLKPGQYILQLNTNGGNSFKRFVKK
ncbi:RICIN domain-containing protein [Reichenbachiella ulvae]|uniref:Family 43 glycosylhydrolase n=1 Tax=Reichenbachiella ulvae TaxID=2980104 RepID=A0ABT3CYJ9_9BACT|nr:RICIN domain-containing protein [Reichenbachiella ulvae]MCV9388775.1 family 43 glycosylhydrolase [Reichenbachiella ulvae]